MSMQHFGFVSGSIVHCFCIFIPARTHERKRFDIYYNKMCDYTNLHNAWYELFISQ